MRAWIEQGFKDSKRGGWQGPYPRMTDPARVERVWLALAVATRWRVRVGGEAEAQASAEALPELRLFGATAPERPRAPRWRRVSVFRQGWVEMMVRLLAPRPFPLGRLYPESWPELPEWPAPAPASAEAKQAA